MAPTSSISQSGVGMVGERVWIVLSSLCTPGRATPWWLILQGPLPYPEALRASLSCLQAIHPTDTHRALRSTRSCVRIEWGAGSEQDSQGPKLYGADTQRREQMSDPSMPFIYLISKYSLNAYYVTGSRTHWWGKNKNTNIPVLFKFQLVLKTIKA